MILGNKYKTDSCLASSSSQPCSFLVLSCKWLNIASGYFRVIITYLFSLYYLSPTTLSLDPGHCLSCLNVTSRVYSAFRSHLQILELLPGPWFQHYSSLSLSPLCPLTSIPQALINSPSLPNTLEAVFSTYTPEECQATSSVPSLPRHIYWHFHSKEACLTSLLPHPCLQPTHTPLNLWPWSHHSSLASAPWQRCVNMFKHLTFGLRLTVVLRAIQLLFYSLTSHSARSAFVGIQDVCEHA